IKYIKMKAKSFLVLAVSCCVLCFSYYAFIKNKNGISKQIPYIKPPLKGVEIAYTKFVINPALDTVITCVSGSKIKIKTHAFVDNKGNIIKGPVTLKFREFKDAIDIFLSGIPMTYDSLGKQYQFESAGMFEILAFKNTEPVFVNPTAPIIVEMASNVIENRFNNYYLDTINKNWQYVPAIAPIKEKTSSLNKVNKNDNSNKNKFDIPSLTTDKSSSKNIFDIDFDMEEFPELAAYKDVKFEVSSDEKNYNPKLAERTWELIKIEKHKEELTYVVTFDGNNESYSFKVKPVIDEIDADKSKKKYEKLFTDYNKTLNKKQRIQKLKQRQTDSIFTLQRNEVDNTNKYGSISAFKQTEKLITEDHIMRVFTIRKFGIWNSDCPTNLPSGAPLFAYFKDKNNHKLLFDHVFLIEKGKKAVFNYYAEQLKKFQFDPNAKNTLIAVTKDNQVAMFSIADFDKLYISRKRPNNDTLSFADDDSVRFIMKVHTMPIKNPEMLKSLINI
ncbi:MAG TPA: hypothetical protein PK323_14900, partial [Bacteroidia bacterium]|nr:hypothetical protein [Bacteroidia bacterium]